MPFPRSQLDVYILQIDPFRSIQNTPAEQLFRYWIKQDYLDEHGVPTAMGIEYFGFGKFNKLTVDISKEVRLYANHQGGYRVFCPETMSLITDVFSASIHRWRSNGRRKQDFAVECTGCGKTHAFNTLIGRPSIAFGKGAIRLINVDQSTSDTSFLLDLKEQIGRLKIVLKRVG